MDGLIDGRGDDRLVELVMVLILQSKGMTARAAKHSSETRQMQGPLIIISLMKKTLGYLSN